MDFPSCLIRVTAPPESRIFVRFLEVILGPQNTAGIEMFDIGAFESLVRVSNQFARNIYSEYLPESIQYYYQYYTDDDIMGLEPSDEIGKKPIPLLDLLTKGSKLNIEPFGFKFSPTIEEAYDMFKFSIEISAVESVPKGKFIL